MVTHEFVIWGWLGLLLLGGVAFFILLSEIRANREEMQRQIKAGREERQRRRPDLFS